MRHPFTQRIAPLKGWRFRTKLMTLTATTAGVALLLSCIGLIGLQYRYDRNLAVRRHAQIAQVITSNIGAAVIFGDKQAARENIASVDGIDDIRWARALLSNGNPIAEYSAPQAGARGKAEPVTTTIAFPIRVKGEAVGMLQMGVRYRSLGDILLATAPAALVLFILCLAIAIGMAKMLNTMAFRPIDRLIHAMMNIGRSGDYAVRLDKDPDRDFDPIVSSFNNMLDEIAARSKILSETAEELRHARDAAEQGNVAKSQFIANMSHELRTPLNAIIGYTEVLQDELSAAGLSRSVEDVEWIYGSARHLLQLINGILDFSKIEAGRMELDIHEIELSKIMKEISSMLGPIAAQKGNVLSVDIVNTIDAIRSDSTKIRQCLLNLGGNACKFTKNGFIVITARTDGDDLIFTVSDSGIGMSADEMEKLFKPFVQADASTTRQYGGTGLGLAITARLAEILGGGISVESTKGEGSTFTLRIRRMLAPHAGEASAPQRTTSEPALLPSSRPERPRPLALIADDERSAVELFVRLVEGNGYDAVVANDGQHCLDIARRRRPDIILLDLAMPHTNGWEVLEQMQADPELKDIPAVVVTVEDDRRRALSAGASEHLLKPVDRRELGDILALYSGRRSGNVLIVEDDPATAHLYDRGIRQMGFRTHVVHDGEAALAALVEEDFTFVVTDLGIPKLNGFELIEAISRIALAKRPSVVVVSGKVLDEAESWQLAGKIHAFLAKSGLSPRKLVGNLA